MTETEPGLYQMKDLVWGSYFLHEKESPEFFQRDENYYPFSITENGAVVRIETEAGVGFLNKAQTGSLKVVKTATMTRSRAAPSKSPVPTSWATPMSRNSRRMRTGEINVELRVGEYTVAEAAGEDAEKYILPDDQTVGSRREKPQPSRCTTSWCRKCLPYRRPAITRGCPPCSARLPCSRPCPAVLCSSCTIPARSGKLPVAAMRIRAQKNENLFQRFLHRSFCP
mgnify:CR=1 FL=1